ncbi:hypothetical protein [Paraoerskovia marina]|uniref:hypothetical protein n=1 Tax=Paraoerskovia marina TaxID=545619 RepID=UPI000492512D|nr:hypothetical protein [Paraoerskovia marina]
MGLDVDEVMYPWLATLRTWLYTDRGLPLESMPDPTRYDFSGEWGLGDHATMWEHAIECSEAGVLHSAGDPLPGMAFTS